MLKIYFGHSEIQGMQPHEIVKLQHDLERIKSYYSKDKSLFCFIFLGITAHWVNLNTFNII